MMMTFMTMTRRLLILIWMLACFAGVSQASAACDTSTSGAAFGNYDSTGNQDRDTTAFISITCSGNAGDSVSYTLSLSSGSGAFSNRHLISGSGFLNYNLYTDISRSQVWGDGAAATSTVGDSYTLSVSPSTRNYTIYGRIPAGQTQVLPGAYSDNIVITLTY